MSRWRVSAYQPGDGGGQSVDLLDQAWFDCTQQSVWKRGGGRRDLLNVKGVCVSCRYFIKHQTPERELCHRLTRITGCRSPAHCGSPFLQSSSPLQPGEGGQEKTQM